MTDRALGRLWVAIAWLPLKAQPGRTLLAIIAVAAGVALGFAIQAINRAAMAATTRATLDLYGEADLIVRGTPTGFDEALFPIVARTVGVAHVNPILEVRTIVVGTQSSLTVLGTDMLRAQSLQAMAIDSERDRRDLRFFNENLLAISTALANELRLTVGDNVTLATDRPVEFTIASIFPGATPLALADIGITQWRFGRLGALTRIDVRVAENMSVEDVRKTLTASLPADMVVATPTLELQDAQQLSRAFRINLIALGLVALFTGAFVIYSTLSLAVVQRRRELAVLHALGATHRQQLKALLLSGGSIGLCGALIGVVVGAWLARFGLQGPLASRLGTTDRLSLVPLEVFGFILLGVGAAVIGSIVPALRAARTPTAAALRADWHEVSSTRTHTILGLGLALAVVPLLFVPPIHHLPLPGYAAIALLLLASVLCIPLAGATLLRFIPDSRSIAHRLTLAHLRETGRSMREGVAATLVSVSLMAAMSIMVTSLRLSFEDWLQNTFPGDLLVQSATPDTSILTQPAIGSIRALPGVADISYRRTTRTLMPGSRSPVVVFASSLTPANSASFVIEESARGHAPSDTVPIWISVALADRQNLSAGDSFTLRIGADERTASIRGVWRDFQFQQTGAILVDYASYAQLSGDDGISALTVWTTREADPSVVMQRIRERIGTGAYWVTGNPAEYRSRALASFDGVFSITYVLVAVAVCVGLLGVGVSASAGVTARRGEFALLRHIGLTKPQIATMIGIEGAYMGALGAIGGLVSGVLVSAILIFVVGRQSFHWTMDWHFPTGILAGVTLAVVAAASLIAVWSSRSALHDEITRAVREDW